MPISVSCACGAALRVRDEAAGKKAKCPKCGAAVLIPAAEADDALADAPTPLPMVPQEGGKPRSTKRCIYCGEKSPADALQCESCGRAFGAKPAAAPKPFRAEEDEPAGEEEPAPARDAGFPWELAVVIAILILELILGTVSGGPKDPAFQFGAVAATGLMVFGLLVRREWGFWVTIVLLSIRILFAFSVLPAARQIGAHVQGFIFLLILVQGLALGLLVYCRVRGAYLKR